MVRRAAGYLVRHGPVTPMDRWEEEAGYFASTLAVEIPALLAAADLAETQDEGAVAAYLRETADAWNAAIEGLIYVTGTDLARGAGVDGYYVRFARPDQMEATAPAAGTWISRTTQRDRDGWRWPTSSVQTPCAWCASDCGRPTTPESSTRCASSTAH